MEKVIIFSHESDIDGLGCIILGKLAFPNLDYELLPNVGKLEEVFRQYITSGKLKEYDAIFITDLALYNPALSMTAEDPSLSSKVKVFDHHQFAIDDGCSIYDFTTIYERDDEGRKTCGTEMFYLYLCQNNFIKPSPQLSTLVEYTRLEDTWEWKSKGEEGIKAHDLAILLNATNKDEYISRIFTKLKNPSADFVFNQEELDIIANKKQEYANTLNTIISDAEYFVDENGFNYGIVFADYEYRNELPEFIRECGNPNNIQYFIVVALNKGENGQKSYRAIVDGFDVNAVAVIHGGGGHPSAASVNITSEQRAKALVLTKKEGLKYLADSHFEN